MGKRSWTEHMIGILIIEEYIKYPILYDSKHLDYKKKSKRQEAVLKILEVVKEVKKDATEIEINLKIKYLRSIFVSECNKILKSQENNRKEDYTPSIWYFYKLRFLQDYMRPKQRVHFRNLFDTDKKITDSSVIDIDSSVQFDSVQVKSEPITDFDSDYNSDEERTIDYQEIEKIKEETSNPDENLDNETNFVDVIWQKWYLSRLKKITDENLINVIEENK